MKTVIPISATSTALFYTRQLKNLLPEIKPENYPVILVNRNV